MRTGLVAMVGVVVGLAGCGAPVISPIEGERHDEEAGITGYDFDATALATIRLPDGVDEASFELAPIAATGADRVGLNWDSFEAGGATEVEVSADGGAWQPVAIDFREFVDESGATLWAGHADLPAGTAEVRARVVLRRAPEANSPELRSARVEVFERASIAEVGEPWDPSSIEEGDGFAYGEPPIVTRTEWSARAPKCEGSTHSPYRLTFHHTVTSNGETGSAARARMRQMQAFHQDSRGWCDIGYHFSIDAAGQIYRGRTTTQRTGSHVGGANSGNIGISLMGTYDSVTPPAAQLDGLMNGFAWLADVYDIAVSGTTLRGHTEWPDQGTSCPGTKTLAQKQAILNGVLARLAGNDEPPPPPASSVIIDNATTLFGASSSWWTSTNQPDRYAANYKVRSTSGTSDPAKWTAALETRNYEVFVWYSQGTDRATEAPYFVYHAGGSTKKIVNQRTNGGRWVSLGTYAFAGGTAERVALSCWTGTGSVVIADAVKFEPR